MRMRLTLIGVAMLLVCGAPAAQAGLKLEAWRGHVSFGFAQLVADSLAPGGSVAFGAGVDYPVGAHWRLGPEVSVALLGTGNAHRGSLAANVDFGMFDAALLATYLPGHGPVTRIAAGPGFASPHGDLVVTAGGAGFSDLAVHVAKPELTFTATLGSRRMKVVSVGAELNARWVPGAQPNCDWTVFGVRLAIHY